MKRHAFSLISLMSLLLVAGVFGLLVIPVGSAAQEQQKDKQPHARGEVIDVDALRGAFSSAEGIKDQLGVSDNAAGSPQTTPLSGTGVAGSCVPFGRTCFGPGLPHCCPAPFPHHSFCSSRTGFGVCLMN